MKSWYLEDIRDWAKENKYTFSVPSNSVHKRLQKGNFVKLIFLFHSADPESPRAERMWVEIDERNGETFKGSLANNPGYIKDVAIGAEIEFQTRHIIDSDVKDSEEDLVETYIHRCMVTNEVLRNKRKVTFLYREESLGEQREGIFDSGWRMMAGDETQEYLDNQDNINIVSLGVVLNIDDSFIGVLDEPVGSEFEWSDEKEEYVTVIK